MKQVLSVVLFILFISSCTDSSKKEADQGIITYAITYPKEIMGQGFSAFLPGEMTTTFKDENFKILIKGEFNIYNLEYISRSSGDTCFTLLKILDKRLYYPQKDAEDLILFENSKKAKITLFKDSTKIVAGYNCFMGTASFYDKNIPDMVFYYTKEINFTSPNANTPFEDVPGPLLEFRVNFQGMDLAFEAKNVKLKNIKDDEFIIPKNYRETDPDEIKEIVSSLMQL
nr:hypothetical protein [uncultured Carboxylicivirga sp.]